MSVYADQTDFNAILFPDTDQQRQLDLQLNTALRDALHRSASGPVGPDHNFAEFTNELGQFDFHAPHALPALFAWTIAQLEHGIVHVTHPRYFGLFNPAPSFPAECADRIVAAFNPQLASATTSPAAVAIEAHTIGAIAHRVGFPSTSMGHFTTSGSEANFTASICALTTASSRFAMEGARAFAGQPKLYVSQDAHMAWLKIAHQTGIGRSALRLIETDRYGRMCPQALRRCIAADMSDGHVPVMIAATAGTTAAGVVDPIQACSEIALEHDLWFHVDAAWGGAAIASDRLRKSIAGIEHADSLTIDAHKWFATTMCCGIFLTRHREILPAAFHAEASFMPSDARHLDPYLTTVQWSRRFLGLRLFLTLAAVGWQGVAEHVEGAIGLAGLLKQKMTALGWSVVNDSPLAVVCLIPPANFPEPSAIVRKIVTSNLAWIACARFQGREVVRVCITNGRTAPRDLDVLAELLHATSLHAAAESLEPLTI